MAFTGVPVVTSMGKRIVKITGVSLLATASGTITAFGGGGDAVLPATFPTLDTDETMVDYNETAASVLATQLAVTKTGTPLATITFINGNALLNSADLEIFIQAPHSIQK